MHTACCQVTPVKPRRVVRYCVIILLLCAVMPSLGAGDLAELRVTEKHGVYTMKMVMLVDAPAEYVRAVLTDYERIYRLNPSITESEILQSPENGVARVRTVMTGCVVFFCRDVERVEDVRELASGDLQAVIVPELSSLRSGTAEWNIHQLGPRTQVTYQAYMEPDFFIPPLIGSFFVKQNMRAELITSFARIECIAKIQTHRDSNPPLQLVSRQTGSMCDDRCDNDSTVCGP